MAEQYVLGDPSFRALTQKKIPDKTWIYLGIKFPDSDDPRLGFHSSTERTAYASSIPIREGVTRIYAKIKKPLQKIKMQALTQFLHREGYRNDEPRRNRGMPYRKLLAENLDEYVKEIIKGTYWTVVHKSEKLEAMRSQSKMSF